MVRIGFSFFFSFLNLIIFVIYLKGRRASQSQKIERSGSRGGLVGRMIGAVTNSVKIGGLVLDSVQQKTNEVIQGALL